MKFLGSISPTYLRTALARTDPKSVKKIDYFTVFLRFWAPCAYVDEIVP